MTKKKQRQKRAREIRKQFKVDFITACKIAKFERNYTRSVAEWEANFPQAIFRETSREWSPVIN